MATGNPLLDSWPMNFSMPLEQRLRAAGGPPAYMRRKRRIEDTEEALVQAALDYYDFSAAEYGGFTPAARASFEARVRRLRLGLLNELIERHNRYYPMEANLPIDVRSGELRAGHGKWEPLAPVTHETIIAKTLAIRGR